MDLDYFMQATGVSTPSMLHHAHAIASMLDVPQEQADEFCREWLIAQIADINKVMGNIESRIADCDVTTEEAELYAEIAAQLGIYTQKLILIHNKINGKN